MSVMGYFERRRGDLRMPKKEDRCGIRWDGPVLSGRMPVGLALRLDGMRGAWWLGERYGAVEEYDPVLRAHCGCDSCGDVWQHENKH